jgi:hypothetical protein
MSQHTHGHAHADGSTHAHAPTDSSTHGHAHGPVPWYGRILETLGFGHTHDSADRVDTALESSARGIRAVKTSLVGLGVTARAIAERARHNPLHSVPRLGQVAVHVDPCEHDGSDHHAETAHHFSDAVAVRHASLTEPAHVPAGAVHARYLDLGQRSTNLRTRAEDWRAGEPVGRTVCLELTDFIGVLVAPAAWPQPLAGPVREIARSIVPLRAALQRDDAAAGAEPLAAIKEASHQLTHSLYEGWLPGAAVTRSREAYSSIG